MISKKSISLRKKYDETKLPPMEDIIEAYKSQSIASIAKSLGVDPSVIGRRLDAAGIQKRSTKDHIHLLGGSGGHNRKEIPPKGDLEVDYEIMPMTEMGKKYGVSNVTIKKWLLHHGISLRSHSETISKMALPKIKETSMEKYGVAHPRKHPDIIAKGMQTRIERHGRLSPSFSKGENEVREYLESLTGYSWESSNRIIGRQELDGYCTELGSAFEYCGLYWHNESRGKGENYHFSKMKACEENGVRLFTIFEDEWKNKKEICKDILASQLGYSHQKRKIYARNCEVKKIPFSLASEFMDRLHIQGKTTAAGHNYALFEKGDIIGLPLAVMSFGPHHRKTSLGWVLKRFVTEQGMHIVGGASKLFSSFIRDIQPEKVISWSDNRWMSGKMYEKLGFVKEEDLAPDYFYVNAKHPDKRLSKQSCTRSALGALVGETEYQAAERNGLVRIWDCGKKKWIWIAKN